MCWQYDVETSVRQAVAVDASKPSMVPVAGALAGDSIRLTDIELLVGNLYAARHVAALRGSNT